jgi:hypothetical protein
MDRWCVGAGRMGREVGMGLGTPETRRSSIVHEWILPFGSKVVPRLSVVGSICCRVCPASSSLSVARQRF